MEVEKILSSNLMLSQCFNQYLSLPIFPVHLQYDKYGVTSHKKSGSLGDMKEDSSKLAMEWLNRFCWPFFLKSQLYCKYRLYCTLLDTSPCTPVHMSFVDFIAFESWLECTVASSLIDIWVSCEGLFIGVEQQWADTRTIRAHCTSVPFLSDMTTGRGDDWVHSIQRKIMQRLKFYWLPRLYPCTPRTPPLLYVERTEEHDKPFYDGLVANHFSGDGFSDFLFGYVAKVFPDKKFLQEGWRLWGTYLAQSGDYYVDAYADLAQKLFAALQLENIEHALSYLKQIKVDAFSFLKRLWSKYQKYLYSSFQRCLDDTAIHETRKLNLPNFDYRNLKKEKCNAKVLVSSDFDGCVLEPLGDVETFNLFEQFVYTTKGPLSEENAYLRLWKSINRYNKTVERHKRDSLAVTIHKTYIFDQSKSSLPIPKELLKILDPDIPYDRPTTPALKVLQKLAEENMSSLIEEFLFYENGDTSAIQENILAHISKKAPHNLQLQEDSSHLDKTLHLCHGPVTQKLKAFGEYLKEQADPPLKLVLANNVQFWLEVKKLKTLYENDASIHILYHKVEALVDGYLDTSTPPWIKISVSSEIAILVVSAVEDLYRSKILPYVDRLMDLFENAQKQVFSEMVPYWGTFCKLYQSPIESTVSLPQVASSKYSLKVSEVNLPPLPQTKGNAVPLLSYSKLKGIKWRGALNF